MKPPNKLNIKCMVAPKPKDPATVQMPIVDEVEAREIAANKCISFWPLYPDCSTVFEALVDELEDNVTAYT